MCLQLSVPKTHLLQQVAVQGGGFPRSRLLWTCVGRLSNIVHLMNVCAHELNRQEVNLTWQPVFFLLAIAVDSNMQMHG